MEYAAGLIKLKPGTDDQFEEWRSTIASRLDEAAATLKDEDVQIESWFKVEMNGESYLLWYLRAKSIKRVFEVSRQMSNPIDKYHYEMMAQIADDSVNISVEPLLDMPRT